MKANLGKLTIAASGWKHGFWVRFGHDGHGPGIALIDTPPLFSERNGYSPKGIPLLFGWRLKRLKTDKADNG